MTILIALLPLQIYTENVFHRAWFQFNWTDSYLVNWCVWLRLCETAGGRKKLLLFWASFPGCVIIDCIQFPSLKLGTFPISKFGMFPTSKFGTFPTSKFGTFPTLKFGTFPTWSFETFPSFKFGNYWTVIKIWNHIKLINFP